jgi:hypothetical protein
VGEAALLWDEGVMELGYGHHIWYGLGGGSSHIPWDFRGLVITISR